MYKRVIKIFFEIIGNRNRYENMPTEDFYEYLVHEIQDAYCIGEMEKLTPEDYEKMGW